MIRTIWHQACEELPGWIGWSCLTVVRRLPPESLESESLFTDSKPHSSKRLMPSFNCNCIWSVCVFVCSCLFLGLWKGFRDVVVASCHMIWWGENINWVEPNLRNLWSSLRAWKHSFLFQNKIIIRDQQTLTEQFRWRSASVVWYEENAHLLLLGPEYYLNTTN